MEKEGVGHQLPPPPPTFLKIDTFRFLPMFSPHLFLHHQTLVLFFQVGVTIKSAEVSV